MATLLEQWWAVQADTSLTPTMKADLLASLRSSAYAAVDLPVVFSGTTITVTSIDVLDGGIVECHGTGPLSWPLRLHSPPIGVHDADGTELGPDGVMWRTDAVQVIADAVASVPS